MKTPSLRSLFAALAAPVILTPFAYAQTNGTWNNNNNANWSTAGSWTGSNIADGAGSTADFSQLNISTGRTVTIDGAVASRTIGTLLFGDIDSTHGYTIAASGGGTLTFNNNGSSAAITQGSNSGANIISAPVLLADSLNINNNSASLLTVSGTVSASTLGTKTITNQGSGNGGVTLSGAISDGSGVVAVVQDSATSALTLSGANTFTGGVTIKKGTVNLGANAAALGGGSTTLGDSAGGSNAASLIGNNSVTYAGGIVLASNTTGTLTIGSVGTATPTFSGGVTGNNNLTLAAGGTSSTITFATAAINNAGTVTNAGTSTGTVTLGGGVGSNVTGIEQNSTTSALTISGGLVVNSGGTTLTNTAGTKALTVSTTGVSGTGNLVLNNNSSLAAGINITAGVNNTGTVTNSGSGTGTTTIGGIIGTNVTGVTQDSATSQLTLGGANTFTTGVTIKNGTVLANNSAALGTGTVLLGDTSGSADATLLIGSITPVNNITVQAGGTGTRTLSNTGTSQARPTGNILLNNDLTITAEGSRTNSNQGTMITASGTISGSGDLNLNVIGILSTSNNGGSPQMDNMDLSGSVATSGAINNIGTGTGRAHISGNISNAASVNQNSATSMLSLSGTNTYTGPTNVNAGILRINNNASLPTASTTTVASGGTLQLGTNVNLGGANPLSLSGHGTTYSTGALESTNNATYSGAIVLAADATVGNTLANTTLTLSGPVTGAGRTLITTGAGNHTFSGAIGTTTGGLIKEGSGITTLSAANTYTGATQINNGVLALSNAGALGGNGDITFGGGALRLSATNETDLGSRIVNSTGAVAIDTNSRNATYSGIGATNTGGLAKLGAGRLTLSGTNAFTGPIVVNTGVLAVSSTSAIPSLGTGQIFIDTNGALNTGGAYATVQAWLDSDNINTASTGVIALTGNSSEAIDLSGFGSLGLGATTNATYSGTLTADGTTYRLGGGGATLTLNNTNALTGANALITNGAVTLGGANNLSGTTTVFSNTLTLNGANGSLAGSTITVSPGATLTVATAGAGITRAAGVTLNRGTLIVTGNNATNTSDTITGALTIGSGGHSTVTVNANGSRNALLNVGSFARTAGGTAVIRGQDLGVSSIGVPVNGDANVNFTAPNLVGNGGTGTDRSIFVGVVGDTSVSGTGFGATGGLLTQDATNGVRRLSGADYKTSIADGQTDLDNVQLTSTSGIATTTLTTATTINSLSLNSTTATNANVQVTGAGTLTLNSGVIYANSVTATTTSGISNTINFNGREGLVFLGGTADLNLSGVLEGTGGNGLTIYAPSRTLTLSGASANTYTGVTTVNGGTLSLGKTAGVDAITGNLVVNSGGTVSQAASNQIADTASVTVNGGALNLTTETLANLTLNGGTATTGAAVNLTGDLSVSGNAKLTTNIIGTFNVAGTTNLSDGGNLTLVRSQNTAGNYDSVTTLGAINIANTSSGSYTAITLNHGSGLGQSGAKLVLGGDVTFTGNTTNTNTVLIDAFKGSGRQGVIELTAVAGNRTFTIGNGAAAIDLEITAALLDGTGASGLVKAGAGTLALSGVNTYSGNTVVNAGALTLTDSGALTFYIGASGNNNAVTGSGTATFNGSFNFDLTNAGTTEGDSWLIVDTGTLSESFTGTFAVAGFTQNADVWTNGSGYSFSEATGILSYTAVPEPSTFALLGGAASLLLATFRRRRTAR